jgi:predicted transcriptional regulator of viral defense system
VPAGTRQDARRRLTAAAGEQSGYFTAAQALKAGFSYQAQKYHADQGNWHRVDRGIFRLPEWPASQHEDLVRWTLWSAQRAVVSHETALSVHGLGDANPARIHLTVPAGFRAKAPELVLHTGVLPNDDIEHHEGYRVTTPLRSLLDVAAGHLDLDQLRTALNDALDRGVATRRSLLARADEFGPHAALRIERALPGRNP